MKHLKKYNENKSSYRLTIVDFTGGGDGVTALYVNGELEKYGDYYHDKIDEWIEGFEAGVKMTGAFVEVEKEECKDADMIEAISELADTPPQSIHDVRGI